MLTHAHDRKPVCRIYLHFIDTESLKSSTDQILLIGSMGLRSLVIYNLAIHVGKS